MEKLRLKEKKEKVKEGTILIMAYITGTTIALLIWGGIKLLEFKDKIK